MKSKVLFLNVCNSTLFSTQLHYVCGKTLVFRLVVQQSKIKADSSLESKISVHGSTGDESLNA